MAKKPRIPHKFHPWIDVRKKFRLSDIHIQMARELGLSPKRFAKYADRKDQPWKLPLTEFIEALYQKQFGKSHPDEVQSIEQIAASHVAKREARKLENTKAALETTKNPTKPDNLESEGTEMVVQVDSTESSASAEGTVSTVDSTEIADSTEDAVPTVESTEIADSTEGAVSTVESTESADSTEGAVSTVESTEIADSTEGAVSTVDLE